MGHVVQVTTGQIKKDMLVTLDTAPTVIVPLIGEIYLWMGSSVEGKRTTALSRFIECRDTLIEQDLLQDVDFYSAVVNVAGSKGSVVLTSGIAGELPVESQVGIVIGSDFGGATGAFETKSGLFKSVILQATERLNEALNNR